MGIISTKERHLIYILLYNNNQSSTFRIIKRKNIYCTLWKYIVINRNNCGKRYFPVSVTVITKRTIFYYHHLLPLELWYYGKLKRKLEKKKSLPCFLGAIIFSNCILRKKKCSRLNWLKVKRWMNRETIFPTNASILTISDIASPFVSSILS